jgi:hypothetical protein
MASKLFEQLILLTSAEIRESAFGWKADRAWVRTLIMGSRHLLLQMASKQTRAKADRHTPEEKGGTAVLSWSARRVVQVACFSDIVAGKTWPPLFFIGIYEAVIELSAEVREELTG